MTDEQVAAVRHAFLDALASDSFAWVDDGPMDSVVIDATFDDDDFNKAIRAAIEAYEAQLAKDGFHMVRVVQRERPPFSFPEEDVT